MSNRILCDVDGVAADFTGACVRTINLLFGTRYALDRQPLKWDFSDLLPPGGSDEFWAAMSDVGVARNLEPLPHAVELHRELSRLAEVWYVTSPMPTSPTWCYERLQWLREHLGVDRHRVVFASDKSAVHGVALIDDRALNLHQWESGGEDRLGILWRQPYSGPWHGFSATTVERAVHLVESAVWTVA